MFHHGGCAAALWTPRACLMRSAVVQDLEVPEPGLPGHDGLEVFQRRCPGQSLVTGAWQQGHVSWCAPPLCRRHHRTCMSSAPHG